jgi:lytic transglycosylase
MTKRILMKKIMILTASIFAASQPSVANGIYPQYTALVEKHSAAQRLDKNLVWAVMGRESSGNRYALSNKDARGLLQVIPPTAARMGVNPKHLYDPEQNIIAGTRYLRFLCNKFPDKSSSLGCNIDLVLAGYNAGEGAVRKYGGIPPYRETQHYVRNVKARYARLSGNRAVLASSPVQPFKLKPIPAVARSDSSSENIVKVAAQASAKRYAEWDVFKEF